MSVKFNLSVPGFLISLLILFLPLNSCHEAYRMPEGFGFTGEPGEVKLIILNPGHYHAYAIHRRMYDQIDPTVHIYAPEGPEVDEHAEVVEGYNLQEENPTSWNQIIYKGDDYLERMLAERKGNVVILAGNNRLKTEYIKRAVDEGLNVFSDKPLVIDMDNFRLLEQAVESAGKNNVLLYDMMTGRHSMGNILRQEIMKLPRVFGELETGSHDDPAIVKENIHHFYRVVGGRQLYRPPWYFDVRQQGEGIVDITIHLVDQVQWGCFPEQAIDYRRDIEVLSASRWPTPITRSQFTRITGVDEFPAYLEDDIENDTVIQVYANGEMNYRLKGVHVRLGTRWYYSEAEDGGNESFALVRGTRSNITMGGSGLCIEPNAGSPEDFEKILKVDFAVIQEKYPGVELKRLDNCWQVVIPRQYGGDSFTQVTEKYLQYLAEGEIPEWEMPNLLSRYYTTARALEKAKE
jgi:predicted dehydrogenase